MAASVGVLLKFEPGLLAAVDRVRGGVPRAVWVKGLCADAVVAHDALGSPPAEAKVAVVTPQRRQLVPGPGVEAVVSSSRAKARVRPIPRG